MTTHSEKRILPYTPEQMYALVADVEAYPEFLPWCTKVRTYSRKEGEFLADVSVGFKGISQTYTSRVILLQNQRVDAVYVKGPFKHLSNVWLFEPHERGCRIEFDIDFEFSSKILQMMMGVVFYEACRRMIASFEARAKQLYG